MKNVFKTIAPYITTILMGVGIYVEIQTRITTVEVQVESMQPWRGKVDQKMDGFEVLLSDIRSDVSFIRGKLEANK